MMIPKRRLLTLILACLCFKKSFFINNINKCIKYPFPIIFRYKIKKIIPKKKENGVGAFYQIKSHNTLLTLKSKAEGPTHLPIFKHIITMTRL